MSDSLKQFIEAREMDPMNMKAGESAVFSKKIVKNGILSFGIGWEMNHSGKGAVGDAVQQDLDCACLILNKVCATTSFRILALLGAISEAKCRILTPC